MASILLIAGLALRSGLQSYRNQSIPHLAARPLLRPRARRRVLFRPDVHAPGDPQLRSQELRLQHLLRQPLPAARQLSVSALQQPAHLPPRGRGMEPLRRPRPAKEDLARLPVAGHPALELLPLATVSIRRAAGRGERVAALADFAGRLSRADARVRSGGEEAGGV